MTLSPFLAVFYCAHFGSRLPGGIRSSGPTPTGSCWRTRQSPPNPLARFRAVATVRCVKTPGLQRPFRSRRLCRAVACAPGIPAKGRRDVRRNAVSQTALHVVAAGPETQQMMGAENIRYRRNYERIFF